MQFVEFDVPIGRARENPRQGATKARHPTTPPSALSHRASPIGPFTIVLALTALDGLRGQDAQCPYL